MENHSTSRRELRKIRNANLVKAAKPKKGIASKAQESTSEASNEDSVEEDFSLRRGRNAQPISRRPSKAIADTEKGKTIRFNELLWTGRTTRSTPKQQLNLKSPLSNAAICPDDIETEAIGGDSDNSELPSPRHTRVLKVLKPNSQQRNQNSPKKLRPSTRQAETETGGFGSVLALTFLLKLLLFICCCRRF